jgi:hypothetical protein
MGVEVLLSRTGGSEGAGWVPEAAAGGEGQAVAGSKAAEELQQEVMKLREELLQTRKVAEQWQSLHAELHQFCAEKVLAPVAMSD